MTFEHRPVEAVDPEPPPRSTRRRQRHDLDRAILTMLAVPFVTLGPFRFIWWGLGTVLDTTDPGTVLTVGCLEVRRTSHR